jgi:hypothetical protein
MPRGCPGKAVLVWIGVWPTGLVSHGTRQPSQDAERGAGGARDAARGYAVMQLDANAGGSGGDISCHPCQGRLHPCPVLHAPHSLLAPATPCCTCPGPGRQRDGREHKPRGLSTHRWMSRRPWLDAGPLPEALPGGTALWPAQLGAGEGRGYVEGLVRVTETEAWWSTAERGHLCGTTTPQGLSHRLPCASSAYTQRIRRVQPLKGTTPGHGQTGCGATPAAFGAVLWSETTQHATSVRACPWMAPAAAVGSDGHVGTSTQAPPAPDAQPCPVCWPFSTGQAAVQRVCALACG